MSLKTRQRFQGKCVSFSLAVPAAKLFIREISKDIASADDKGLLSLNKFQREQVLHWRFLDDCVSRSPGGKKTLFGLPLY